MSFVLPLTNSFFFAFLLSQKSILSHLNIFQKAKVGERERDGNKLRGKMHKTVLQYFMRFPSWVVVVGIFWSFSDGGSNHGNT